VPGPRDRSSLSRPVPAVISPPIATTSAVMAAIIGTVPVSAPPCGTSALVPDGSLTVTVIGGTLITGATVVTDGAGTLDAGGSAMGGGVSVGNDRVAGGDSGPAPASKSLDRVSRSPAAAKIIRKRTTDRTTNESPTIINQPPRRLVC
jgi:hypothetical protein